MNNQEKKPVKLFIAYSLKDEELYKGLEVHLKKLKASGQIHSWYERKIVGKKWDRVISDKLETSDIILMLISPDFLAADYCYESEVKKAVDLHKEGKADFIPVILTETGIEDTPFSELKVLPSKGRAILSKQWKDKDEAFKDIMEGIRGLLKKIINPTEDIFMKPGNRTFPHCIKQFNIKNFQCLKQVSMHDIPVDAQWVFITGENGTGKTALLQAMAIALLGNEDKEANDLLKRYPAAHIEIEFKHNKRNAVCRFYKEKEYWNREITGIESTTPAHITGYGVTRLNIQSKNIDDRLKRRNPAFSLYNETEGNFQNIEEWLKERPHSAQAKEVRKILAKLMPNIDDVNIEDSDVFYDEMKFKAEFLEISSGSKSIAAMVGDLLIRLFEAQGQNKKVSEFDGIVLIDELDLHMHPKWQKKLPGLLSEVFPGIQFWATTHSIVPLMGAPENSIFTTLTRTPGTGTGIEKLNLELKNISPNILMSSPAFNVDILPAQNTNPDEFQTHDDWQTLEKFKKIDDILKQYQDEENGIIKPGSFNDEDRE